MLSTRKSMIEREQSPFSQSVKARQIRFLIPKPRPGGPKNIFNKYATKVINPKPPALPLPPPFLTKFVIWKAFYLSRTSTNTVFLVFFRQRTNEESQSQIGPKSTQFPPKIILFQIQKYKNNVLLNIRQLAGSPFTGLHVSHENPPCSIDCEGYSWLQSIIVYTKNTVSYL